MNNNVYISGIDNVFLNYEIPKHLRGIQEIEQLRQADLEFLDRELKEKGSSLEEKISSKIIWRMDFPKMILDVLKLYYNKNCVSLHISPIHPHRADLAYKNDKTLNKNVSPLTANALLRNSEGNFVVASRGGSLEGGKIVGIPGGHTDYTIPPIVNPFDTFRTEFEEELGYQFESRETLPIVGVFSNRDTKGVNILYKTVNTSLSFYEILERWKSAKDRGEHNFLFEVSQENVKQLAKIGKLKIRNKDYFTTPFFQDCFRLITF